VPVAPIVLLKVFLVSNGFLLQQAEADRCYRSSTDRMESRKSELDPKKSLYYSDAQRLGGQYCPRSRGLTRA
jgi:hypothetical protein